MKNITKRYRNKTALIVSLCLLGGISQAANYDISSEDLFAPSQEDEQIRLDSPFDDDAMSIFDFEPRSERQNHKEKFQDILKLVKERKIDEAEVKTNKLLKQFPNESNYHNLQALIKIQQKNKQGAISSFQNALKQNPSNSLALQGLAVLALENDDLNSAQDYLDRAIATNFKAVGAYLLKANIAIRNNSVEEAEKVLMIAFDKVQGDVRLESLVAANLVKLYKLTRQPVKSLNLAQTLAERYPDDLSALSLLAEAQHFNQQLDSGKRTLQKIIAQDRQDIDHRLLLARLLMNRSEDSIEAAKIIDEALQIDSDNLRALTHKTLHLIKEKKFEQAVRYADKIDTKFPKAAAGKMLKADIYLAQRQLDQALAFNRQAYQIQPNPKILSEIAALLAAQGKANDAISLLSNELDRRPDYLSGHLQIANLYLNQQNYAKAESHYKVVFRENPDNPMILNNLAMVYLHQNNPKALELAEKAHILIPDSAAIADTYGIVLLQQGRVKDALDKLQKAADLAPASIDIQLHLAKAHQANGNKQAAIEILEKIVNDPKAISYKPAAGDLLRQLRFDRQSK